jgi:hypothetical protein
VRPPPALLRSRHTSASAALPSSGFKDGDMQIGPRKGRTLFILHIQVSREAAAIRPKRASLNKCSRKRDQCSTRRSGRVRHDHG